MKQDLAGREAVAMVDAVAGKLSATTLTKAAARVATPVVAGAHDVGDVEEGSMVSYSCTLRLVRRLWPVVDGEHFHGEIMRFRLTAEPLRGADDTPTQEFTVELRIGGPLLAHKRWDVLTVREVAAHGRAFLCERLQHEGLPQHSPTTFFLNEATDDGAYREGSPFSGDQLLPGRPFSIESQATSADSASL